MKQTVTLTIASLLSILLLTFHQADDIVRGFEGGGLSNLIVLPIFAVWLYGTLVLTERRSGYLIVLIGSLLALCVPIIHMTGKGFSGPRTRSGAVFFFVWTILAVGVSALFSAILSARGLWSLRRGRAG
jgi:hypothetical protein